LKENNCHPRLLYPAKLFFIFKGNIKTIYDKQNLKELMSTMPTLQRKLTGILNTEEENKCNHENTRKNKSH
jgi:hypothetical protein